LTTSKTNPKDADLLITVADEIGSGNVCQFVFLKAVERQAENKLLNYFSQSRFTGSLLDYIMELENGPDNRYT
jgi:hypothetical protein